MGSRELTFKIPLPFASPDGDPYLLTGNMDGLIEFAGEHAVRERKTTKTTLGFAYFDRYEPDVQIDNYDLAAFVMFGDTLKPTGVMIEAMQVAQGFSKFMRQFVSVPTERREEWLRDLEYWIKQAEQCARDGYYPKNTSACHAHGRGCQFRHICSMAPSARAAFMPEHFTVQHWNPLDER